MQSLTPQPEANSFEEWWDLSGSSVPDLIRKGLNSLIVLGAWTLWNHRNRCVFDEASPSVARPLLSVSDESFPWGLAGARGLNHLLALVPNGD